MSRAKRYHVNYRPNFFKMIKYFKYFLLIFIFSCNSGEDVIKREIKLKEARKGYELLNYEVSKRINIKDTSELFFKAIIKTSAKDSAFQDSIFFIKGSDGVLLPFSANPLSK